MYTFIFLTWLPGPAMDWLTPGSRANTINGLNSDLILSPLFQVLYSELPLQAVHYNMGQNASFGPSFEVLDAVANKIWIAIVLPLWKRLRSLQFLLNISRLD